MTTLEQAQAAIASSQMRDVADLIALAQAEALTHVAVSLEILSADLTETWDTQRLLDDRLAQLEQRLAAPAPPAPSRIFRDTEYSGPLEYYIPLVERMEAELATLRAQLAQLEAWQDDHDTRLMERRERNE